MAKRKKQKHQQQPQPESRAPIVALINLGCSKNTVDSETALGELITAGFELAVEPSEADLVLINTCGFIESAREESCAVIEEHLALKDSAGWPKVAAMGCLSERLGNELAERFPELDGIFGLGVYGNLPEHCMRLLESGREVCLSEGACRAIPDGPRLLLTDASYAYLRIAEGCDNRCAYCAIPQIRGPLRSRAADAIVAEAKNLVEEMEIRELVLVAQDTTCYGKDLNDGSSLAGLLKRLLAETEAARIRILYAHPRHLTSEVIHLLGTEPRLCGYLDLPIQHINSGILGKMGRKYDRARVGELLAELRGELPEVVLRTSLIVGFPGETEEIFQELLDFVKEGHFRHLGAFAYSPETGTAANDYDGRVSDDEIERRLDLILKAQAEVAFKWLDSRIGQNVDILIDRQVKDDLWVGRSVSEAPEVDGVIYISGKSFYLGGIFHACLDSRDGYDMKARPV